MMARFTAMVCSVPYIATSDQLRTGRHVQEPTRGSGNLVLVAHGAILEALGPQQPRDAYFARSTPACTTEEYRGAFTDAATAHDEQRFEATGQQDPH